MKKIRLFFYGVIFLAVLSGQFSTRTVSGQAARTTTPATAIASQSPQTPEDLPPPSIRFARITIAEGLSNSKVDVLLQDQQGFLWVGTERGLNKYDGYQFTSASTP